MQYAFLYWFYSCRSTTANERIPIFTFYEVKQKKIIFFLQLRPGSYVVLWPCWTYAPINVKPAGGRQGMGWGFDCLCWSWGRAFDQSCSPGGGDIWIFLRPTSHRRADRFDCRLGRKRLRPNICFPTSTLHARDVRSGKIWKSWKPTRTSQRRVDFTVLINWTFGIKVNGSKEKLSRFLQVQLISVWLTFATITV